MFQMVESSEGVKLQNSNAKYFVDDKILQNGIGKCIGQNCRITIANFL